jgi:hypothetical protein
MVASWSSLTGWSASKVASNLIEEAGNQKGCAFIQRLSAEARAVRILKQAGIEAGRVRAGKEVGHAK